jgi:hypothetical protein
MRLRDVADAEAERLFDLVRNTLPDADVIEAIAESIREASRGKWGILTKPMSLGSNRPPSTGGSNP